MAEQARAIGRPSRLASRSSGHAPTRPRSPPKSPRRYGARHIVRTVDRAEFEPTCRRSSTPWTSRPSTASTPGSSARPRTSRASRSRCPGSAATSCFGGYPSFRDVPRSVHWLARVVRAGLGALARRGARCIGCRAARTQARGHVQYGGSYAGAYLLRRGLFMPWELDELLDQRPCAEGLRRLSPLSTSPRAACLRPPATSPASPRSRPSSTCATNSCATPTGRAWPIRVEIRVPYVDPFFLAALPSGELMARIDAKDAVADVPATAAARGRAQPAQDRLRHANRPLVAG